MENPRSSVLETSMMEAVPQEKGSTGRISWPTILLIRDDLPVPVFPMKTMRLLVEVMIEYSFNAGEERKRVGAGIRKLKRDGERRREIRKEKKRGEKINEKK
jgi:hypothetical protein